MRNEPKKITEYKAYYNKTNKDGLSNFLIHKDNIICYDYGPKTHLIKIGNRAIPIEKDMIYPLKYIEDKKDPRNNFFKVVATPYVDYKNKAKGYRFKWAIDFSKPKNEQKKERITLFNIIGDFIKLSQENAKLLEQSSKMHLTLLKYQHKLIVTKKDWNNYIKKELPNNDHLLLKIDNKKESKVFEQIPNNAEPPPKNEATINNEIVYTENKKIPYNINILPSAEFIDMKLSIINKEPWKFSINEKSRLIKWEDENVKI